MTSSEGVLSREEMDELAMKAQSAIKPFAIVGAHLIANETPDDTVILKLDELGEKGILTASVFKDACRTMLALEDAESYFASSIHIVENPDPPDCPDRGDEG